jgi:ATP-dependent DNA ligase
MAKMKKSARAGKQEKRARRVTAGAVAPENLKEGFPRIEIPIRPPYPPMEAKSVDELPAGEGWLYEPKWDGFRCLAFRRSSQVLLQSKSGQPLGRYFPEIIEAFLELPARKFVLDGEIVIVQDDHLSFDDLLLRIHPAASRIRRLSQEMPATYLAFDLLVDEKGRSLVHLPLEQRRRALEDFFLRVPRGRKRLSFATRARSGALDAGAGRRGPRWRDR